MTALESAYQAPGCSVVTFGGEVVVMVLRSTITMEGLHASVGAARRLALRNRRGVAALTVIGATAGVPGPEIRRAINQSVKDTRAHTVCAAQVLRGEGFWMSAMRGVLTAVELIQPGDLPRRTFDDIPVAARWIAEHLKHDRAWAEQLTEATRSTLGTPEVEVGPA